MKSDNLRLISEILDSLGPNWTNQTIFIGPNTNLVWLKLETQFSP